MCDEFLTNNTWDAGIPALLPDERLTQSQEVVQAKDRGVSMEDLAEGDVPENARWCAASLTYA